MATLKTRVRAHMHKVTAVSALATKRPADRPRRVVSPEKAAQHRKNMEDHNLRGFAHDAKLADQAIKNLGKAMEDLDGLSLMLKAPRTEALHTRVKKVLSLVRPSDLQKAIAHLTALSQAAMKMSKK